MYPGPIRNQAFDILFLFEATAVAFIRVMVPRYPGGEENAPLLSHGHENAVSEKIEKKFFIRNGHESGGWSEFSEIPLHLPMETRVAFGRDFRKYLFHPSMETKIAFCKNTKQLFHSLSHGH